MTTPSRHLTSALRHGAPLLATLACLWLLRGHLPQIDLPAIAALIKGMEPHRWALAALCTAASLSAVGFYDVTVARVMGLPISDKQAFAAGWRATAIAQTLGFGVITGALVRWRLLGLRGKDGLWVATKMTSLVTASYFYGWLIVAGLCAVIAPGLPPQVWWLGLLALWVGLSLALVALRGAPHRAKAHPPVLAMLRVTGLTFLDTLFACAVIYCFLPEASTPFLMLYASFLVAYSIGMVSGVPGGVGPFEMCLVALLAPTDPAPLLAAILGYRAVYFLAPALLAGVSLIAPKPRRHRPTPAIARAPDITWPAEAALASQGPLRQVWDHGTGGLACDTHNTALHLRDPSGPDTPGFLRARRAQARTGVRRLVLYKCSAPVAKIARKIGLLAFPIASEAILRPQDFTTDGKTFSQLRRKLRQAAKAGVTCEPCAPRLYEMRDIDRVWQARSGAARGFSVGQFSPELVARQASFTAYQDGRAIAFITCHVSPDRWVLDLMRSGENCPDGTMHALVIAALGAAKAQGVGQFSLCSVPFYVPGARPGVLTWALSKLFARSRSATGLLRFKSAFAPDWKTEFIAADGVAGLALGLYDLGRLITAPHPPETNPAHEDYADYEFASLRKK